MTWETAMEIVQGEGCRRPSLPVGVLPICRRVGSCVALIGCKAAERPMIRGRR